MNHQSPAQFDVEVNTIIHVEPTDDLKSQLEQVTSNLTHSEWFGYDDDRQERDQ